MKFTDFHAKPLENYQLTPLMRRNIIALGLQLRLYLPWYSGGLLKVCLIMGHHI